MAQQVLAGLGGGEGWGGRERGWERRGGERRGGKRREESVWKGMEGRIGEGGRKSRGLDKFRFTGKMEREVEMEK